LLTAITLEAFEALLPLNVKKLSCNEGIMKTWLITALLTGVCVTSAFAADSLNDPQKPVPSFEQTKADILNHIDQSSTPDQALKACVQSAQSYEVLKACREKYSPRKKERM
jgi:hypothetical protein